MCRRRDRKWKVPINHMACLSNAQVNAKKIMLFAVCISLPELNFIPSMESKHLFGFFWQGTQSRGKAIQFYGLLPVFFLPKWLSISHRDHYCNVCQNMFKIWSCKNRNQVSFFEGSINSSYILGSWGFQLNRFKVIFFFLQWKRQVRISWESQIQCTSCYSHFS